MKLDGIRQKVFLDRYALKDTKGNPVEKTPDEMWKRVAKGIAEVEKPKDRKKWEKKFYALMYDFKFLPGGRILAGAGTGFDVTYYNCFVIPNPPDSRGGIMANLTQMIEIMAHGGGVGLNLSSLRPRGSRVKKVNGFSSGPLNWAELYSLATKDIVQQGGSRRGALMLMLHDWHPDIEEFITIKQDLNKINGANLSVCLSDAFMEAVKKDGDWDMVYPDLDDKKYDKKWKGDIEEWKKIGGKIEVKKTVKARMLWDLICTAAWKSAEPGLHFLDRSNKRSNTWYFERLIATNPCGEQPLSAWAVCNLGAMNLAAYVEDKKFDYENFGKDAQIAVRFLDNVIDDTHYFYKENEKVAKDIRRQGLGILGLADALIKMEVKYGSDESLKIIDKMFKTLRDNAYIASSDIALEKGSFPKFNKEKYLLGWHIKKLPEEIKKKIAKQGIRNAVLLTIAPTGTTGLLSGASSGIEPVYEFAFTRKDRLGEHQMYHPLYEDWKKAHPSDSKPDYFVSANDLTPQEHVKVQAVAQEYIDASISKTVNAPQTDTVEDVKKLYEMAHDMGLKGITYMREGSREGVYARKEDKKEEPAAVALVAQTTLPVMPRPYMVEGVTYKSETPVGQTFITINHNENNEPFEVFITVGKSGSEVTAMADALGRMISLNLRLNGALSPRERVRQIVAQLIGIGGARSVGFGANKVLSLPDAVAKVLSRHFEFRVNGKVEDRPRIVNSNVNGYSGSVASGNGVATHMPIVADALVGSEVKEEIVKMEQLTLQTPAGALSATEGTATGLYDICPDCGAASLAYEEGCKKCYACGYSEC
jgi:ribonucleoside-diphosphate reductase alpha chain